MGLHRFRFENLFMYPLFFILFLLSQLSAQKEPHFELFNISSGLSTMEVTSLFQDSQGFLWLGALGAVNRYNGYEFEKIKLDTSANGQLGNFQNFGFYEDDRGWIWINSDKGLFKYDPETNLPERFQFHEGSGAEQDFVMGECQLSDSIFLVAAGYPEESLYRLNIFTGFKTPVKLVGQKKIIPNDFNIVGKMVVTDPGKVWIFHYQYGLLLYTINTGFFTQILPIDKAGNEFHFTRVSSIIHKPGESDYWIGDANGVYKYNLKTNKIQKYLNLDYPKVGNPANLYNNFALDKDNNIWMSARNYGLYVIRDGDEKVIYFPPNPENLNFLTDKFVDDIIIDKFNIMWLANNSRGLLKYDMSREPIHLLKNEANNNNSLIGSYIFSISEDPLNSNVFIIGSNEAGLNIFDKNNDIIKRYTANPKDPKSISMNSIRSSYRMPNGEYWLGTWGQGLDIMDRNMKKIRNIKLSKIENSPEQSVRSIKRDSKGNVWIGTVGRLFRYFTATDKIEDIPNNFTFAYDPNVLNLVKGMTQKENPQASLLKIGDDADTTAVFNSAGGKILIIGMGEGIVTKRELSDFGWLESSHGDTLWTMYNTKSTYFAGGASKNRIRMGLLDLLPGEYKIRYKSDDSHSYGKFNADAPIDSSWWGIQVLPVDDKLWEQLKKYDIDPDWTKLFIGGNISHIISQGDKVWIATQTDGLNKYDYNTGLFTNYDHSPEKKNLSAVKHFAIDGYGTIWEATSQGLVRFDPDNNKFHQYTVKDGLPSNFVESIVIDNDGDIWLATENGICRFVFDRQTKKVTTVNYGYKDGLQGGSFVFNVGIKSKEGEVFFGGSSGLNYFNPPQRNIQPPKILLNKFVVNGQSLERNDPDSPLKGSLGNTKNIGLNYYQNNVEIDFIALHYARPYRNQYKYRLIGFNDHWVKSERRFANYTNLAPGEYTFQVTGSNGDGVWNEEGISINILIHPPWWKTIPAYIAYFLILAMLIFAVDRFQRHRLLKRERGRTALMEAELRAQAAEAQAKVVQAESERKSKELEEARTLQLSLLPTKVPIYPNVQISTYMQTATEVGGDYYDFAVHQDGSLIIAIGDATGHGLKAGTLVTAMKSLFITNSPNMVISEFYESANRGLKEMHFKRVLMGFAVMKINNGSVQILNAGMPPIFHFHRATGNVEEIKLHVMPLGAMESTKFEKTEISTQPGDTFLMLSDGLPELLNKEEEMFGYVRILEHFKEVAPNNTEEIVQHFKECGSAWVDDEIPEDDVTLVAVKLT